MVRRTGSIELLIDGLPTGTAILPLFMVMISSTGVSIGHDHGSPVSTRYQPPYAFTGTLFEIVIQLLTAEETDTLVAKQRSEMSRQ